MGTCDRKHTKFQPTDEQWKCPKCGGELEIVWDPEDDSFSDECTFLHVGESVQCNTATCKHSWDPWTATGLARALEKKYKVGMKVCECCKGRGYVKGE